MRRVLSVLAVAGLVAAAMLAPSVSAKAKPIPVWSMYWADPEISGFQAMVDSCTGKARGSAAVTTYDRSVFQANVLAYLLDKPGATFTWFAGDRMRFFANHNLLTPLTDVWAKIGSSYSAAFRTASSANGVPYFVPMYDYPWVVLYRKSVFAAHGYAVPQTMAQFTALATKMQHDGLDPLAFGDAEGWTAMGMFDILDMRMNGYQFHVDLLAGKQQWTDARVKAVFQEWAALLPYTSADPLSHSWQDGAQALIDKTAGMFFMGTFAIDQAPDQATRDDIAMFPFPLFGNQWDTENAIDAPIDGLALAASTGSVADAKKLLECVGGAPAQLTFLANNPAYVAAAKNASTSGYTPFQKQMAQIIGSSNKVAQFLDRDTRPDFGGPGAMQGFLQWFISDPSQDLGPFTAAIQSFYDSLP
jgi:multiple sugar transport system substrate-binding protein